MKIRSADFELSAPDLRSCPRWALPEFAFIGRSNVGKSSLINLLTGRRDLAKVSGTPGKTQLLNFYVINGEWSLVDLPGYGYARVGEQRRLEFNAAVADFLAGRRNLRGVFVLIDSRLPPQALDREFLRWLDATGVRYALVFTKADKQSESQTKNAVAVYKQDMSAWRATVPDIIVTSAQSGAGRGALLNYIADLLAEPGRTVE